MPQSGQRKHRSGEGICPEVVAYYQQDLAAAQQLAEQLSQRGARVGGSH